MTSIESRRTAETKKIEKFFREKFPAFAPEFPPLAYRQNVAAIRVRIVSPEFDGLPLTDREKKVMPLLRQLPDEIQDQITMLLLLTPEEIGNSLVDCEFRYPNQSAL